MSLSERLHSQTPKTQLGCTRGPQER
uniref:Uncharacterized protein n=1 Tax=Timema poppense TaxID=170557 RepID=A0A7R9DRC0_TIMPO|nr:unnamed protein product [Timema poppensis]